MRGTLRRDGDMEEAGWGEEGLHAEDRRTGRRGWWSMRQREEEESGRGVKHERHSVCTSGPPTKRSRCHQTWEGQKISWIRGERKTHVGMAGAAAATAQGGQRAVILFREGRERQISGVHWPVGQPSLLGEFHANERLCLKKQTRIGLGDGFVLLLKRTGVLFLAPV